MNKGIKKGTNKGKKKQEKINIEGRVVSRDMQEIEAETVAFLICSRWNLENNPYEYLSYHLTKENIKQISVEVRRGMMGGGMFFRSLLITVSPNDTNVCYN